nr:MAG: hypothetical protein [Caudoviricetes sp.]
MKSYKTFISEISFIHNKHSTTIEFPKSKSEIAVNVSKDNKSKIWQPTHKVVPVNGSIRIPDKKLIKKKEKNL